MTQFDLFSLREVFANQGVMICFNGPFSHSVIEELGIAVRKYLESDDAPKDRVADVFAVFIEQAQNLKNYTAGDPAAGSDPGSFRNGTLVIARDGERFIVSSGNVIRASDRDKLEQALREIVPLDKAGLKSIYKARLRAPAQGNAGAGLGLIDMARRASAPIVYSFRELSEGHLFFNISVFI